MEKVGKILCCRVVQVWGSQTELFGLRNRRGMTTIYFLKLRSNKSCPVMLRAHCRGRPNTECLLQHSLHAYHNCKIHLQPSNSVCTIKNASPIKQTGLKKYAAITLVFHIGALRKNAKQTVFTEWFITEIQIVPFPTFSHIYLLRTGVPDEPHHHKAPQHWTAFKNYSYHNIITHNACSIDLFTNTAVSLCRFTVSMMSALLFSLFYPRTAKQLHHVKQETRVCFELLMRCWGLVNLK